ncbi:MFS family permease [Nocardia sp. GAS34]|uniref:MFS transporter n=1 Tax=unclassified Nocardia TaxID=2637762 RepID=UPI003D1D780A
MRTPLHSWLTITAVGFAVLVATIGYEVAVVASTINLAATASSSARISAMMIVVTMPSIVFSPWIGRFIDRYPLRITISVPVFAAGVTVLVIGNVRNFAVLLAVIAILGLNAAACSSAVITALPEFMRHLKQNVPQGSAALEAIRSGGFLVAPPIAGLLVGGVGYRFALSAVAVSYVLAGLIFASVVDKFRNGSTAADTSEPEQTSRRHLLVGFQQVLKDSRVWPPLTAIAVIVLASAVFDVLLVFYARFNLGFGAEMYGLLLTAWSIGLLIGPLLVRFIPITTKLTPALLAVASGIVHATGFGVAVATANSYATFALFGVGGIGNALQNAYLRTLVLESTRDSVRGSVVSAYIATLQTAAIIGMGVGGLVDPHAARPALVLAAMVSIVAAIAVLPSILRSGRPQPDTLTPQMKGGTHVH